ncbi:hypothetical protein F4861DRAFT_536232 [Xylaria intraflava]|nr:hypothetical protein F4861DRAFT_536232 [Xylaria intraflava]
MSNKHSAQITSWLDHSPEILLSIIGYVNSHDRIALAIALPKIFLRPTFNIFRLDAEQQVARQNRMATTPLVETEDTVPLLHAAIEFDDDISVIEEIVKIYKSVCPTSIDGIWGEQLTAVKPPLAWAAEVGNPLVVSLLLDEGADPLLKNGLKTYENPRAQNCALSGFIHDKSIDRTLYTARVYFRDAIDTDFLDLEECAMILHNRGGGFQYRPQPDARVEASFQEVIYYPIIAGFSRLVQAILDPMIEVKRGEPVFQMNLYHALQTAWSFQKFDDEQDTIKYLLSIGAPLDPLSFGNNARRVDLTYAALSFFRDRPKTGALLFDALIERQIPLEYGMLFQRRHRASEHLSIPFAQSLYHVMNKGNNFYNQKKISARDLHRKLLTFLLSSETAEGATTYLIEQGVGDAMHLYTAIVELNEPAVTAFLEHGFSINEPIGQPPEIPAQFPLEISLNLGNLDMSKFLIRNGANPWLLPVETRQIYEQIYLAWHAE